MIIIKTKVPQKKKKKENVEAYQTGNIFSSSSMTDLDAVKF